MKTIQYYRCSLSPFPALELFLWCFVNVCFAWKVSWRPGHESEWSENVIRGRLGPGLLHIDLTRWGHGNSESWQVHTEITVRRIRDGHQTWIKKILHPERYKTLILYNTRSKIYILKGCFSVSKSMSVT